MKSEFKINEIAKLYGIGADSLRYYEKLGLLQPRRAQNGYRQYSLRDMYKLTIIRDLRQLDFTMEQIKAYLDHQSVENTLDLLRQEHELVEMQIARLQHTQRSLVDRMNILTEARTIQTGHFTIKNYPDRPCLQLRLRITRDEETDYAVKMLHQKHRHHQLDLGNQWYGASVSLEALQAGIRDEFNAVFFIFDAEDTRMIDYDYILPAGKYLSLHYRGSYRQSYDHMMALIAHAKDHGHRIAGDPFEMYVIDNRDTAVTEEFLTEIQVRID